MIPIPTKIAHRSRVGAAFIFLERVDNLHRADLGCATHRPGREGRAQHVVRTVLGRKLSADIGNDVHHVTIPLHDHLIIDRYRAMFGNAPHVIASEIDQHDMFRAFFFVGEKFGSKRVIFLFGLPSPTRSGNRTNINSTINGPHVDFRRTSHERKVRRFIDEHVRRWIDVSQCAIKINRRSIKVCFESLTRHDLKGITSRDVFLGLHHHALVFLLRRITPRFGSFDVSQTIERRHMKRTIQHLDHRFDPAPGISISLLRRIRFIEHGIGNQEKAAQLVIKNNKSIRKKENRFRQTQVVLRRLRNRRLELLHRIVTHIAHRPAEERWGIAMSHGTIAFHETLYFIKDITFTFTRLHLATTLDGDFIPPGGEYPARLASNDGPSSAGICAFRALKEKGIFAIAEFQESRDRSLEVSSKLGIHRHDVSGL